MRKVSMTWPQYLRQQCSIDGVVIQLSPNQTQVVSLLLMRRGSVVTPPELLEHIWPNPDEEPEWAAELVKRHIMNLRKKFGVTSIITQRGRGYEFV